jgi:hypothetical protein
MKSLLFSLFLVFVFCLSGFSQTNKTSSCPKIEISLPRGSFVEGYEFTFLATVGDYDWKKLDYKWTVSHGEITNGQGTPVIKVPGSRELNGQTIKVIVEIKGLPANCTNKASESLKIIYNPGTPLQLDDYEKISFSEEKVRLDNIAIQLKEDYKDAVALFIIYYAEKDTKQTLSNRIVRISNYLSKKHNLSKERFNFVFSGVDKHRTKIYLAPINAVSRKTDWRESLAKLKFQNKTSKKPLKKGTKQK